MASPELPLARLQSDHPDADHPPPPDVVARASANTGDRSMYATMNAVVSSPSLVFRPGSAGSNRVPSRLSIGSTAERTCRSM